jgi:hypothetical protein
MDENEDVQPLACGQLCEVVFLASVVESSDRMRADHAAMVGSAHVNEIDQNGHQRDQDNLTLI